MTAQEKINADSRVKKSWNEGKEDGVWVELKNGFADFGFDPGVPTHFIHEWSWRAVKARMKNIKPCHCEECQTK